MKVNRLFSVVSFLAFAVVFVFGTFTAKHSFGGPITVVGDVITIGSGTLPFMPATGTAANGSAWTSFMTGTSPVAYFVVQGPHVTGTAAAVGSLMLDPRGRNANIIDFRYGSFGTISSTTPGPYVYATGTGANAVSTSSVMKTYPAGSWGGGLTTFPARLQGAISLTGDVGTLSTTGDNIASSNGWFNQPWDFGLVAPSVTQSSMFSTSAGQGFRAAASVNNPSPQNLLGYGNGIGMFSWTEASVTGVQYGAVIPVWAVPEPATMPLAVLGGVAALGLQLRRRTTVKSDRNRAAVC